MSEHDEDATANRFAEHLVGDVDALYPRYKPNLYRQMIRRHGGVGAARRLLADPGHTSYGFRKLWELGELQRSMECAVLLPWFSDLFSVEEQAEAERRLLLHEFPLYRRLSARASNPPEWTLAR